MINKSRKEAYIAYVTESKDNFVVQKRQYMSYFNQFGSVTEDILNKDICDLTIEEIKTGFSKLTRGNRHHIVKVIKFLEKYTEWCIFNGFCTQQNNFSNIRYNDLDMSERVSIIYFSGYEELLDFIYAVFDVPQGYRATNMYVAVIFLIYFGVKFEDIEAIKTSDYSNGVLDFRNYHIDFRDYSDVTYALDTVKKQMYMTKGVGTSPVINADKLIKQISVSPHGFVKKISHNIRDYICKYSNETGYPSTTISDIEISGLFYRMKLAEDSEGAIARNNIANDYIYSHYSAKEDRKLTAKMRDLMANYYYWKSNL